jgi:hypothetical protein
MTRNLTKKKNLGQMKQRKRKPKQELKKETKAGHL